MIYEDEELTVGELLKSWFETLIALVLLPVFIAFYPILVVLIWISCPRDQLSEPRRRLPNARVVRPGRYFQ